MSWITLGVEALDSAEPHAKGAGPLGTPSRQAKAAVPALTTKQPQTVAPTEKLFPPLWIDQVTNPMDCRADAKVLVLCLGNDIRRDDGVGWAVADELTRDTGGNQHPASRIPGLESPSDAVIKGADGGPRLPRRSPSAALGAKAGIPTDGVWCSPGSSDPGITVKRSALSGLYLLDEIIGYDRVIVVDAVKTGAHPPGTVLSFPFEALGTETGPSPHAVGLPSVVKLGRQSGVPLPTGIHIVAIEVDDMESIAEGLTDPVRDAVPRAVAEVRALLAAGPP